MEVFEFQDIFNYLGLWIIENKIEIFGFLSLIAYLYFSIKQNILLWPLGLIGALVYIYIYFTVKLYADMGLQVYYVFISIYGWFYWSYTKENNKILKYMGETPFTQGFPEGSPGRVGHWTGWQIIKKYMKNNPSITIKELMQEKDAQKILNLSKYKP